MEGIREIIEDAYQFISRLTIINKAGKKIKLNLNSEQLIMLETLITGKDTLVLKPRQIGSSTIVAAYLFWRMYSSRQPTTIAILSYKLKSSKHLFNIIKQFHTFLPAKLKRKIKVDSSTEFQFEDTGARVIAESAGGEGGLRSFTCSYLWLSEFAFSPNPEELLAAATSALNDGQMIIESTAKHFNDAHHQEVIKAQNGLASWEFLFFPWTLHAEYSESLLEEDSLELQPEEQDLFNQGITLEQILWRRNKIEKIGLEMFMREYPLTVEEAYAQLGDSYFKKSDLQYIQMISVEPVEQLVFEQFKPDSKYAMGVDTSAGVGRDFSVIYVLSKLSGQPAYVYRSNTCTPVNLAKKIQEVSKMYGDAKILVESNNMGAVVLNELRHLGATNLYKTDSDQDFLTTSKSKNLMFENLKKTIATGQLRVLDNITVAELRALTVNDKGNVVLPENMSSHGDNVVALALAVTCLDTLQLNKQAYLPDWIHKKKAERIAKLAGANTTSYRRY